MRVVVTGQIGLDKKQYLEQVAALATAQGESLKLYHIGDMMYRELPPDVIAGRIFDLPLSRLNSLRRAVFRDILSDPHPPAASAGRAQTRHCEYARNVPLEAWAVFRVRF